jgi:hypothetical protein
LAWCASGKQGDVGGLIEAPHRCGFQRCDIAFKKQGSIVRFEGELTVWINVDACGD